MPGAIWVFAEHSGGTPTGLTLEAMAAGRELALATGGELTAVVTAAGGGEAAVPDGLALAAAALVIEGAGLDTPAPSLQAAALAAAARDCRPQAIIIPLSNQSLGIGPALAEMTGGAYVNSCRGIRFEGGRLTAECTLYGGKMIAVVRPRAEPAIFGLLPGFRPPESGRAPGRPAGIGRLAPELAGAHPRFVEWIEPVADEVNLTAVDILVAVGRGLQGRENLEIAEELAGVMGGAVCGSRPAIDQGWLPLSRQVGKSGATVKPKLYLAAGISGAPEHVEGMRNAELIVAINTDPAAPIFQVAHYGIVGDVLEVLPALSRAARARRSERAQNG
jgi:electron transfer flavoprotein alpha subunit